MRLRFWLGFAAVAAIAIGSVVGALVVHAHEARASSGRSTTRRRARRARPKRWRALGRASWPAPPPSTRRRAVQPARVRGRWPTRCWAGRPTGDRLRPAVPRPGRAASNAPRLPDRRTQPGCGFARAGAGRLLPADLSPPPTGTAPTAARLRLGADPDARRILLRARDSGQAGGDPGDAAAARRHRHQRLPPGLPRRRSDRDRRRAPRRAGRLRDRRLPRPRPDRGGDHGAARRRRRAARRERPTGDRARAAADEAAARRCGSPTAPGCWSSATRTGPASACRS